MVEENHEVLSVAEQCRILDLHRSTYYSTSVQIVVGTRIWRI